jgi:hypothetical protein
MKNLGVIFIFFFSFTFIACSKEELPSRSLLKSKECYYPVMDSLPYFTFRYFYDEHENLVRINRCRSNTEDADRFEEYEYDRSGNRMVKMNYFYANDSVGWYLHDSTRYKYENRLLNQEDTWYSISNNHWSKIYTYSGTLLTHVHSYSNGVLDSYIVYEYSAGKCVKESLFFGERPTLIEYRIYEYEQGYLKRSSLLNRDEIIVQNVKYSYDSLGRLILEEALGTEYLVASPVYYVYKYEYY